MTYDPYRSRRWTGLALAAVLGVIVGLVLAGASLILAAGNGGLLAALGQKQAKPPVSQQAAGATAVPGAAAAQAEPAGAGTENAADSEPIAEAQQGRITVLIMGTDNRPGEPIGRTDTIMVLTVNPATGSAALISLARDLLVPLPGMNTKAKINTAYVYGETNKYPGGGPAMLRKTVTNLLGYPIDYYVQLNFEGFRQIIDQIGGIDVDVPTPINDPLYPDNNYGYDPLYIPAGHIHMNGTLALKFARTRHVDSDYGRARRQQQVVMAVKDKLSQPGNLAALLPKLPGLAVTLAKSVHTDIPVDKAVELARMMEGSNIREPVSVVVDDTLGKDSSDPTWGFVLIPDMVKVRAASARAFSDHPEQQVAVGGTSNAVVVPAVTPAVISEAARLAVLNGTSTKGLATQVATTLSQDGYKVVGIGDADSYNYTQTWLITYGDAAPATREALVRQFNISSEHIRNETGPSTVDMALVLGADVTQTSLGR